ncbi:MAG TPA: polysaccharide biosynthesis/export family protein [Devosiaceae bacterium]|nr:polysaccharide biosynthesis/export family protein [Devosiaceae bacterium]
MRWLRFLAFFTLVGVAGCATSPTPETYLVQPEGVYRLDTGDVVRLAVYGEDQLSDLFKVDDAGQLSLPLIGSVGVRGLTTREAAGRIGSALAQGFIRTPDVAVEVAEYRPFYIQGEVASSGQYAYVYGMSVRAAVSTAGGYTDTANRTAVIIYRRQGDQMVKGRVGLDFLIYPGDAIVVEERFF